MELGGIAGLGVRPELPDHLQGQGSKEPFPDVRVGRSALPGPGADPSDSKRDDRSRFGDRVTISPEARQLLEEEEGDQRPAGAPADPTDLSTEDRQEVQELASRDAEVRRHEQAHVAASGHLPTSGPSYAYETGPDGRRYAVGGEVQISFGEGKNPEETIRNAEAARRAALAPADPSAQDRRVAAKADALAAKARVEQREEDVGAEDEAATDDPSATLAPGDLLAEATGEDRPTRGGLNTVA